MIVSLSKKIDFRHRFGKLNFKTEIIHAVQRKTSQKCTVVEISCHKFICHISFSTSSFFPHSYFALTLNLVSAVIKKLSEYYIFYILNY